MTESLPTPPLDAEVDLRDFQFMPLDVQRLRDSGFASRVRPEAFRAGLLLWCAAWHQQPSGSLPDDDIELAKLAGYGYVIEAWQALRTEALYGWILCSDGRLYHDVVVEKAREAWFSKLENAYKKECDRLRKQNKQRKESKQEELPVPSFDQWDAARRAAVVVRPRAVRRNSGGNPQLSSGKKSDSSAPPKPAQDIHSTEKVHLGGNQPSNGNGELSGGNPTASDGHIYESNGNAPSSAGIPSENALKGQGQGHIRDRDRDIYPSEERANEQGDADKSRYPNSPTTPPGGGDFVFVGELTVELTEPEHHQRFLAMMAKYPEYLEPPNPIAVEGICRTLIERGEETWDTLDEHTERFANFVTNGGRSGAQYVIHPLKHYTDPARRRAPWTVPPTKAEKRLDKNLAAAEQAKRELQEEGL